MTSLHSLPCNFEGSFLRIFSSHSARDRSCVGAMVPKRARPNRQPKGHSSRRDRQRGRPTPHPSTECDGLSAYPAMHGVVVRLDHLDGPPQQQRGLAEACFGEGEERGIEGSWDRGPKCCSHKGRCPLPHRCNALSLLLIQPRPLRCFEPASL